VGRTIISQRDVVRERAVLGPAAFRSEPKPDAYTDRLIKYIPPDVIVAYTAIGNLIDASRDPSATRWAWVAFVVVLGATPFYLVKFGKVGKPLQVAVSTIAFVVWAVACPVPPFKDLTNGLGSAVILALYTFLVPLFSVT
jgi:hypothetical protein